MRLHKLRSASRSVIVGMLLALTIARSTSSAAKETLLYTFTPAAVMEAVLFRR